MKVVEKGIDRKAGVHIYVEGQVPALEEYGEHIDPANKAICSYVPFEEGHQVKVGGRFSGTTLTVAHDVVVDGIYRKVHLFVAKSANNQKSKKLDSGTFLYKSKDGILDTIIAVEPVLEANAVQSNGPETVGTIELRLYITRQLCVQHNLSNVKNYYHTSGIIEDEELQNSTYKLLPSTFQMAYEKNSAVLDDLTANGEKRSMDTTRPGTEP